MHYQQETIILKHVDNWKKEGRKTTKQAEHDQVEMGASAGVVCSSRLHSDITGNFFQNKNFANSPHLKCMFKCQINTTGKEQWGEFEGEAC